MRFFPGGPWLCIKDSNYLLFKRGLRLFKGLWLLLLPNVPGATFIQGCTFILDSRVWPLWLSELCDYIQLSPLKIELYSGALKVKYHILECYIFEYYLPQKKDKIENNWRVRFSHLYEFLMALVSEDESFLGLVGKQSRPIWPFIVFFFHVWQLCAAMMSWVGYLIKRFRAVCLICWKKAKSFTKLLLFLFSKLSFIW